MMNDQEFDEWKTNVKRAAGPYVIFFQDRAEAGKVRRSTDESSVRGAKAVLSFLKDLSTVWEKHKKSLKLAVSEKNLIVTADHLESCKSKLINALNASAEPRRRTQYLARGRNEKEPFLTEVLRGIIHAKNDARRREEILLFLGKGGELRSYLVEVEIAGPRERIEQLPLKWDKFSSKAFGRLKESMLRSLLASLGFSSATKDRRKWKQVIGAVESFLGGRRSPVEGSAERGKLWTCIKTALGPKVLPSESDDAGSEASFNV